MTARSLRLLLPVLVWPVGGVFAADTPAGPAGPTAAPAYPLETYAQVGASFARNTGIEELGWSEEQFNAFLDGIRATYQGRPLPFDDRAKRLLESIAVRIEQIAQKAESARKAESVKPDFSQPARVQEYVKRVAKEYSLQVSDTGLAYGLGEQGANFRPGPDDTVVISCNVVAYDQQTPLPQLNLKEQRRKVAELPPGLVEGIQMMAKGGSAIFIVPPDLSFGSGAWPAGVERGTPLIYMVMLHDIIVAP